MSQDTSNRPDLAATRAKIDAKDEELAKILGERGLLALDAKAAKADDEIVDPDREARVVEHLVATHDGPLSDDSIRRIARVIVEECRNLQIRDQ